MAVTDKIAVFASKNKGCCLTNVFMQIKKMLNQ